MKRMIISLITVVMLVMMMLPADIAVVMGQGAFDFDIPDCPLCKGITFTDKSSGGVEPYTYYWDFGDGSNSTKKKPTHHYAGYGNFTVTLTVTDSASDATSKTETLTLAPKEIIIEPLGSSSTRGADVWPGCNWVCTAGDTQVTRAWLGDINGDELPTCTPGSPVTAYIWVEIENQTGTTRYAVWLTAAIYIYTNGNLTQSDLDRCIADTISAKSTMEDWVYNFTWTCGSVVVLANHPQVDPEDGLIISWLTSDPDAPQCINGAPTDCKGSRKSQSYCGGNYTVEAPLVADFTADPICYCDSCYISFIDATSGGVKPYTYDWNFGGNYTYSGDDPTELPNPVIHYEAPGIYTVTLNVTDFDGTWDIESHAVTVYPSPTAYAGEDTSFCAGGSVQLNGSATGGTMPYTYDWTGPENHADTQNPTISTPGTYTLTVTDDNDCTSIDSIEVTVVEAYSS